MKRRKRVVCNGGGATATVAGTVSEFTAPMQTVILERRGNDVRVVDLPKKRKR